MAAPTREAIDLASRSPVIWAFDRRRRRVVTRAVMNHSLTRGTYLPLICTPRSRRSRRRSIRDPSRLAHEQRFMSRGRRRTPGPRWTSPAADPDPYGRRSPDVMSFIHTAHGKTGEGGGPPRAGTGPGAEHRRPVEGGPGRNAGGRRRAERGRPAEGGPGRNAGG